MQITTSDMKKAVRKAVRKARLKPSRRLYAGTWLAGLERILPLYRKRCRS